jgi:hypothetical protein
MIFKLLSIGIIPQMWHPDYKNSNDQLKVGHYWDIFRIQSWIDEEIHNKLEAAKKEREKTSK